VLKQLNRGDDAPLFTLLNQNGEPVSLAQFFDQAEGFTIREKADEQSAVYGIAYHTALRDDDDLFSDLQEAEERSFSYNESWLVELEFNIKDFI